MNETHGEQEIRPRSGEDDVPPVESAASVEFAQERKRQPLWVNMLLVLGLSGVVLAAALLYLPRILDLCTSDIPAFDDSAYLPQKLSIPAEGNGAYLIEQLRNELRTASTSLLRQRAEEGYAWTSEEVERWNAEHADAWSTLLAMSEREYYHDPIYESPHAGSGLDVTQPIDGLRTGAYIAVIRAEQVLQGYGTGTVWTQLEPVLRIAASLERPHSPLIYTLTAANIRDASTAGMRRLLNMYPDAWEARDLQSLLDGLQKYARDKTVLVDGVRHEYAGFVELLADLEEGTFDPELFAVEDVHRFQELGLDNYYFRPNETRRLWADWASSSIANMQAPCHVERPVDGYVIPDFSRDMSSPVRMYVSENVIGKVLFSLSATTLNGATDRICRSMVNHDGTVVRIALALQRARYGSYPKTLAEIDTNILDVVPMDAFTNEPFVYTPQNSMFYSYGINRRNDAGADSGDSNEGDLVFTFN